MNNLPFASYRQRLAYQYTVKLTGRDAVTGEIGVQYIRINSTSLMTKNQATARASDLVIGNEKYTLGTITDATVTLITRQNPNLINA